MTTTLDAPATGSTYLARRSFVPPSVLEPAEVEREITIELDTPDRRVWLAAFTERELNGLLRLERGWDGYRASPVSTEAAMAAVDALFQITDELSLPPQFFPLPDGGVQFEWHVAGESIEAEVGSTGEVHVLATDLTGAVIAEGPLFDDPGLATQISSLVRRLSFRAVGSR